MNHVLNIPTVGASKTHADFCRYLRIDSSSAAVKVRAGKGNTALEFVLYSGDEVHFPAPVTLIAFEATVANQVIYFNTAPLPVFNPAGRRLPELNFYMKAGAVPAGDSDVLVDELDSSALAGAEYAIISNFGAASLYFGNGASAAEGLEIPAGEQRVINLRGVAANDTDLEIHNPSGGALSYGLLVARRSGHPDN